MSIVQMYYISTHTLLPFIAIVPCSAPSTTWITLLNSSNNPISRCYCLHFLDEETKCRWLLQSVALSQTHPGLNSSSASITSMTSKHFVDSSVKWNVSNLKPQGLFLEGWSMSHLHQNHQGSLLKVRTWVEVRESAFLISSGDIWHLLVGS